MASQKTFLAWLLLMTWLVPQERVRVCLPVSFDIAKDGHLAAVLTLIRSKYRLGDTVQALLCINHPGARVRVVRVSIC